MFETIVSHAVIASPIATVSKYHIPDKDSGVNIGRHPLVTTAKKAFWKQRTPLPEYHGTYDISLVSGFRENIGENENLTLGELSVKTAFLLVFSTVSRYC